MGMHLGLKSANGLGHAGAAGGVNQTTDCGRIGLGLWGARFQWAVEDRGDKAVIGKSEHSQTRGGAVKGQHLGILHHHLGRMLRRIGM